MNRVREKRQLLGFSQEELARLAGIPRTTISAIESGRAVPSVDYAIRLSKVLGCSVEELFSQEEFIPFPGFERGLFVSYRVGHRKILFPVSLAESKESPEGFLKKEGIEWFEKKHRHTYTFAGCDPSFKLLSEALREEGIRLLVVNLPSMKALELLKAGFVHMAGMHMGSFEENVKVARDFLGEGYRILRLFSWEEGIMARKVISLRELGRKLWLAREEGSGARKVFDELRIDMNIENFRVVTGGHENIAFSLK
ncbi:MAG: helix-turn-helix domain-containing protein, partial [Aquificota bacterium]